MGIEQWNEIEDEYAFVYCNPEKGSKKVLVKCLVMNDKLLVAALADGASEPMHNEIRWVILLTLSLSHTHIWGVSFIFLFLLLFAVLRTSCLLEMGVPIILGNSRIWIGS